MKNEHLFYLIKIKQFKIKFLHQFIGIINPTSQKKADDYKIFYIFNLFLFYGKKTPGSGSVCR